MSGAGATEDADQPKVRTSAVSGLEIRKVAGSDRGWIEALLVERWWGTTIVTRGRVHDASGLSGLVAMLDAEPIGLVTWVDDDGEREIVTLDAIVPRRGVGRALVAAAIEARPPDTIRVWIVTTNDNVDALIFFQKLGFHLAAVHAGAVAEARLLKPEIPEVAANGVPIRDEMELEMRFEAPLGAES